MRTFRRFVPFVIFLLPFLASGQNLQQNQVYNAANEVVLKIFGTDKNYNYRSEKFAGRIDNDQNFFEFTLPVLSVYPLEETNDITVFRDLFLVNKVQQAMSLTASFKDPLTTIEDFKSPKEVILDGWLMLADRKYNVPVVMSLFYNNEVIYYKLRVEIDMYKINWMMPDHYRTFLTGILHIHVNDGKLRNFYTQAR